MLPLQTLVLYINGSKIAHLSSSLSIRAGYLAGTETFCAGHVDIFIMFEKVYANLNYKQKLKFIDFAFEKHQLEGLESIKEFAKAYKFAKALRNRPPDFLVHIKKMEKIIDRDFSTAYNAEKTDRENFGLVQLRPLMDSREIFSLAIDQANTETPRPKGFPLSTLLALQPDPNDDLAGKELFLLPFNFDIEAVRQHLEEKFGDVAKNRKSTDCFFFPNINLLSADELRLVRNYLLPATLPFNAKVFEWINVVKTNPSEGENFLNEQIIPLAQVVQQLIDSHPLMQNMAAIQHHRVRTHFTLSQIPITHLWEFFRFAGAITIETEKALEEVIQQNPDIIRSHCAVAIVKREVLQSPPQNKVMDDAPKKNILTPMNNTLSPTLL